MPEPSFQKEANDPYNFCRLAVRVSSYTYWISTVKFPYDTELHKQDIPLLFQLFNTHIVLYNLHLLIYELDAEFAGEKYWLAV